MARDVKAAALALHRFGLGPRAGSIQSIASDPQGALLAELDRPGAGLVSATGLLSSGAAGRAVFEFNAARNAKDRLAQRQREAAQKAAENSGMENAMAAQPEAPSAMQSRPSPFRCPGRFSSTRQRHGSMSQIRRRSALSSGWCGSGPTIFASTPTPL